MADYLNYVAGNSTLYNSFFQWKKYVTPQKTNLNVGFSRDVCNMCVQLQLESFTGIQNKVIKDFDKFYSSESNCKYPEGNNFTHINLIL